MSLKKSFFSCIFYSFFFISCCAMEISHEMEISEELDNQRQVGLPSIRTLFAEVDKIEREAPLPGVQSILLGIAMPKRNYALPLQQIPALQIAEDKAKHDENIRKRKAERYKKMQARKGKKIATSTCLVQGCTLTTLLSCRRDAHQRWHDHQGFPCDACKISFPLQSRLNHHNRACHFPKEYECTVCGNKFGLESYKTNCERRHTLPFVCDLCGMCLPDTGDLKKHMKRSHVEVVCPHCGKHFGSRGLMNQHSRNEHPNKLYTQIGEGIIISDS